MAQKKEIISSHDFLTKLAKHMDKISYSISSAHAISFLMQDKTIQQFLLDNNIPQREINSFTRKWGDYRKKLSELEVTSSDSTIEIEPSIVTLAQEAEADTIIDDTPYSICLFRNLLVNNFFDESAGMISNMPQMEMLRKSKINPSKLFPSEFRETFLEFEDAKRQSGVSTIQEAITIREKIDSNQNPENLRKATLIPSSKPNKYDKINPSNILSALQAKIFGQDPALKIISDRLVVSTIIPDLFSERPQTTMFFAGPSGVGKTETAEVLSKILDRPLLRLNMNEYNDQISSNALFGTSPGYIGYDRGGILVDYVLKNPNAIVLFDEFEKSHETVQNSLLQIFDKGTSRTNKNEDVSFKNTIIIAASNAGVNNMRSVGFNHSESAYLDEQKLSNLLKPELLGRLGGPIEFKNLTNIHLEKILDSYFYEMNLIISDLHGLLAYPNSKTTSKLIQMGSHPTQGARPLRGKFNEIIKSNLAHNIANKKHTSGNVIIIQDINPDNSIQTTELTCEKFFEKRDLILQKQYEASK